MKVAVIGHKGSIGARRFSLLQELGHKVTGFDKDDVFTQSSLKHFDAVFICSPNNKHIEHVAECIHADVPFFCEKPLTSDIREANYVTGLLIDKDLVNMVCCNLRFSAEYQYLKQAISNVGTPLYTTAEFGYYLPFWRKGDYRSYYSAYKVAGGGILLDAIHEFDYIFDLFGPIKGPKFQGVLVYSVHSTGELQIETEDTATVFLVNDKRHALTIHLDYLQRTYSRKFSCVGTKGRADIVFNIQDNNSMYRNEMAHFLECVKQKKQTCNPLHKHLEVLDFVTSIRDKAYRVNDQQEN